MTYEQDFERKKFPGGGLGDYQTNIDTGSGGGKWLLLAVIVIVGILGAAAIFSGGASVTFSDGSSTGGQTATTPQVPIAPSE